MKSATRASRYAIIKKLGEGGYGKALLVRNKDDKHLYVMKQVKISNMSAKDKRDALHEATILSVLHSPYIVKFTESFEEKGILYIVMEYADGGDLCQMIERRKRSRKYFTEDEILFYFIQVSLALKYLHDRKVLHRDLKAQNVFLMKNGAVKLGDFGIAKVLQNTMQLAMSQIGTPYYLSPEICNNRKYNSKTDIWSLGCMLYEMCTFNHPFDAKDVKSLMKRIIQAKYVPISNTRYSQELQALLSRMLNKDPNQRPSINQILGFPFIKIKLHSYLDQTIQNELNHTILHGQRLDLNHQPINHPPTAPPKPEPEPKKAPVQQSKGQQKPLTPQIQQHPAQPSQNVKPQTPVVRQNNDANKNPAKPVAQKPAVQQNHAKQPQKPAVQQSKQPIQQQKQPIQQQQKQPIQQQQQKQQASQPQQNQKVVIQQNQPQQSHSNNGNAKPPSSQNKRPQPPSARGGNAKKAANQQPKKSRQEQIAEFKKYAAEREAKRLQQERELQEKKNDEEELKLTLHIAEAEAETKAGGKKEASQNKEKLQAKLAQIQALKKWSQERELQKQRQEEKRKQEEEKKKEEERKRKEKEEAERIRKEAEKQKQKRDNQKIKEMQELKQKQQKRLEEAAAYRKQQDEEERQRIRHLEEEEMMQEQLESLMPDESKLPVWAHEQKLSPEEQELQMLSRKPLAEMSNEERARFAQLQRHEMRRNKEKGTGGTAPETNDDDVDMNEYDEIDEEKQNEINYEMALSLNQALNLPEVGENENAEAGFESEDEDGVEKNQDEEMEIWESSFEEEEEFPEPSK